MIVEYSCGLCKFKTTIRKKIRAHVRELHRMTGGHESKKDGGMAREPLSSHYGTERRPI